MLIASRPRDFHPARMAAKGRLITRICAKALASNGGVWVLPNVRFAFFSILLSITFNINLDENSIIRVDEVIKWILLTIQPRMDDYIPFLRPFFTNHQKKVLQVRQEQLDIVIPLINRRHSILKNPNLELNVAPFSYIDSLLDLKVDGRDSVPTDPELVTLYSELINGGTDTTSTAIEWISSTRTSSRWSATARWMTPTSRRCSTGKPSSMSYCESIRRHVPPDNRQGREAVVEAARVQPEAIHKRRGDDGHHGVGEDKDDTVRGRAEDMPGLGDRDDTHKLDGGEDGVGVRVAAAPDGAQ
ncbi:Cytochrome P450 [Canna indica]|uniref:Cytochrome P450 n=1 Tax=Canna indica TaxID=4628 RepID=A0AAQ3KYI3_9LILI|nr:Cytochrome P450 [Canna indica]